MFSATGIGDLISAIFIPAIFKRDISVVWEEENPGRTIEVFFIRRMLEIWGLGRGNCDLHEEKHKQTSLHFAHQGETTLQIENVVGIPTFCTSTRALRLQI